MAPLAPPSGTGPPKPVFAAPLLGREWLSPAAFELRLARPEGFAFRPGQRIRIVDGPLERDYSLAGSPREELLRLCVRLVPEGSLSRRLASMPVGEAVRFSGPYGYFLFQPSDAPPVFVATGTGIAPFRSMAAAGAEGFLLFHGVRGPEDLYYAELLRARSRRYVPCLTAGAGGVPGARAGRVTGAVRECLAPGAYDFYLCGRREMVRDMTFLADDVFPQARLYTEIFF